MAYIRRLVAVYIYILSQAEDQTRFTISEVAAYWHELLILQRIRPMRRAAMYCPRYRTSGSAVQNADIPPPQSATLGLHAVARKLLLISRLAAGSP